MGFVAPLLARLLPACRLHESVASVARECRMRSGPPHAAAWRASGRQALLTVVRVLCGAPLVAAVSLPYPWLVAAAVGHQRVLKPKGEAQPFQNCLQISMTTYSAIMQLHCAVT